MILWKSKPRRVLIIKRPGLDLLLEMVKVLTFLDKEGIECVVEPLVRIELVRG